MAHEEQWRRELSLRQIESGAVLDGSHVIMILDSLIDEEAKSLSSAFPFILVMPAAEQDLSDFLSHSPMAGSDWQAVAAIMRQLAEHLQYLHVACNSIHSDVKPRNIVKLDADGIVAWILIDLDAACKRGTPAGQKMTSSSKLPPELARYPHRCFPRRQLPRQDWHWNRNGPGQRWPTHSRRWAYHYHALWPRVRWHAKTLAGDRRPPRHSARSPAPAAIMPHLPVCSALPEPDVPNRTRPAMGYYWRPAIDPYSPTVRPRPYPPTIV